MPNNETIIISDFLVVEDNGKASVNHSIMLKYLENCGFRCEEIEGKDVNIVRIIDRIIYPFTPHKLTQWLRDNVFSGSDKHLSIFTKNPSQFFNSDSQIRLLKPINDEILRDTQYHSFVAFQNGMAVVSKEGVALRPIKEVLDQMGRCIYAESIIKRDFEIEEGIGNFQNFCTRAVGQDGILALRAAIGYMLHIYKDMSNAKMIAFADIGGDLSSGKADGGSGKSLIAKTAIELIRPLHYIDGKNFNNNDQFKWQGVKPQHNVIAIEDIRKDFDNYTLFNMVTGDMSIQDKYKAARKIPFAYSPKIIITANSGVAIDSGSEKRRVCCIGFTDYYNHTHSPYDEFGQTFFVDWNRTEWNRFYNFMLGSIQVYLQRGLKSFGMEQIQIKHLYERFGQVVIDKVLETHVRELLLSKHTTRSVYAAISDYIPREWNETRTYMAVKDIMAVFGFKNDKEWKTEGGVKQRKYWFYRPSPENKTTK